MNIPVQPLFEDAIAEAMAQSATVAQFAAAICLVLLLNSLDACWSGARAAETAAALIEPDRIAMSVFIGLALGAAAALIFIGVSFWFHTANSGDACHSRRAAGLIGNPESFAKTKMSLLDSQSLAPDPLDGEIARECERVAFRAAIRDRMSDAGRAALQR